jgi:ABC-type lipoprotein export system ATPase subunit
MVTHNPELAAATDRAIHIRDGAIEKETVSIER